MFQINYREAAGTVRNRFDDWLQESLTKAMEIWRTTL
jgi:hypothetical protein